MSIKDQMDSAMAYMKDGQYDKARKILQKIEHPKAEKWLAELNRKRPPRNRNGLKALAIFTLVIVLLIVGVTAYARYMAWGTVF